MKSVGAVDRSYLHCRDIVRRSGSNFSLSFLLLPRDQRRAMNALYAFAREADDLADAPAPFAAKQRQLSVFREQFEQALLSRAGAGIWPALSDAMARFDIPPGDLRMILTGVDSDLQHSGFSTFDELREYCLHVASAVGLACLAIWRANTPAARELAVECGIAFQLTNILRDLTEDAHNDRCYLPLEDLHRFELTAEDLLDHAHRPRLVELIRFEADRAAEHYRKAAALQQHLQGPARRVYALMYGRYANLLAQIRRDPPVVLRERVRVPLRRKIAIACAGLLGRPLPLPK